MLSQEVLLTISSLKIACFNVRWSISNGFGVTESTEISLKGNDCNFSVDYNAIDKSDMLNIH